MIAAKSYLREDNLRKAAAVLEPVWKNDPHSQIADLYVRARSDTTIDRLKRAERLESLKPNNIESLFAVAQAALDAKEFAKARAKAEAAARIEPRESIFLLMADIEEAETGDQGGCVTGWRRRCAHRVIPSGWQMVSLRKNGFRFRP